MPRGRPKGSTTKKKRSYNKIKKGVGEKKVEFKNLYCYHCGSGNPGKIYSTNPKKELGFTIEFRTCKDCGRNYISRKMH